MFQERLQLAAASRARSSKARPFETVDCETDPFKRDRVPKPFLWGRYNGLTETYTEYRNAADYCDDIRRERMSVYAHNGGKFDYFYLRDEINSDEPIMLINGRMAKFRIGECEFRDSLNIFPNTQLADFGVKNRIDYRILEADQRDEPNNAAEISSYLRQDCVGLWDVIARYRTEYGKGLTQAGASMRYWEQFSGNKAPRQTKIQHDRYKPYYYGGRVQCFQQGILQKRGKTADMNSAYPRAMKEEHAFSPEGVRQKHLPPEPQIYQCLIKLDCTSRGALPWRVPEGETDAGELFFPDDEAGNRKRMRTYTVTGWEFMTGLELGALSNISIREVHRFTHTVNFADYIDHFYALREDARRRGDVAGRIFGKYFMNSLYGKFGANCENYAEYVIATADSFKGWVERGYRIYKEWGDRFLMTRKPSAEALNDGDGRWRYYNVATAASVTGRQRAELFRAMSRCSGLIYCDTDSITAEDVSGLDFGPALGQWKDEGTFDYFAIAGKKLYANHQEGAPWGYCSLLEDKSLSWKIASKGVNFANLPDGPEQVASIAQGLKVAFTPEVPTYSITRQEPRFIPRVISRTARDMSKAPDDKVSERRRRALAFGIVS